MANFCIMNIKKQGRAAVFGLQVEANRQEQDGREFDNSDIDRSRTADNYHLRECENWNREITRQIHAAGVKERKDSIVLLTGVYTASPEWFEQHTPQEWRQYFEDCLAFHEREYGRCINAVVHLDEQTPHMQVASVPIVHDEKGAHLSAKIIMGGREDMRLRQDRFYHDVGRVHSMERGERRDPAEIKAHTTKREWQIATQEQRLEQARRETAREQAKTQEAIDRRQASIEQADAQKLEALRERDRARAGRDVTEALARAQERVLRPVSVEVGILSQTEEKKGFTGKIKPATVTIERADLERLQGQAEVNEQTRMAAASMTESLKQMKQAAAVANENRIDKQAAADRAAVSAEGERADGLQRELTRTRQALAQEQQKTAKLSEQLTAAKSEQQETREVLAFFPDEWDKMKQRTARAREMERLYNGRGSLPEWSESWGRSYVQFEGREMGIRAFIQEYLDECKAQDIPHEKGMAEHLENLMERSRGLSR